MDRTIAELKAELEAARTTRSTILESISYVDTILETVQAMAISEVHDDLREKILASRHRLESEASYRQYLIDRLEDRIRQRERLGGQSSQP